jgi:hypothetical protein
MNPSIVKNYRALLTLIHPKPRTCELLGDDLNTVKTDVTNILGGSNVTFTPSGPVILIYHPSFQGGKKWLGEITAFDVTEDMSVGAEIGAAGHGGVSQEQKALSTSAFRDRLSAECWLARFEPLNFVLDVVDKRYRQGGSGYPIHPKQRMMAEHSADL